MNVMSHHRNYLVIIPAERNKDIEFHEVISVPNLDELKKAIGGGHIEIVPYFNTFMNRQCVAFCDEEGKMKGFKTNTVAQYYWNMSVGRSITEDYLVGQIAIVVGSPSFLARL